MVRHVANAPAHHERIIKKAFKLVFILIFGSFYNALDSKMPPHNRLCSRGLILKQKQAKTVEWLIAWQKHLKKCPVCTKRSDIGDDGDTQCPICFEEYGKEVETENGRHRQVIPLTLPTRTDNEGNSYCGHKVCKHCLIEYFSSVRHRICPICRTEPGNEFINETLGIGAYTERNIGYLLNVSSLFAILIAEGCFVGLTLGVVARKMMRQPTFNQADPQTVFALHYLALLATWIATHKLIKAMWRPAFDVENPGAQFELARSISRKTKMGKISLLAGATAGILASKPLLREYEKIAKFLED